MNNNNKILFTEMIVLFAGIPLLLVVYQTPALKFIILISSAVYSLIYVIRFKEINLLDKLSVRFINPHLKNYLIRVFVVSVLIILMGIIFRREAAFSLPYNSIFIPLLIIGYPLLSVLPQEIIYRLYFFERYKTVAINKHISILINALLFSFMHIIYGNPIAVIFTFFGGILLCLTYNYTKSLLLTIIEHTVYGYMVFLSGYGQYFISENIFKLLFNTR